MLKVNSDPKVVTKFQSYPCEIGEKLIFLRKLILETASELTSIAEIEETLKWGEPSYLVKKGSTIRIAWKAKKPEQYGIYFKCTSKLVASFKELYGDRFTYEDNRAIIFTVDEEIPKDELKVCISLALKYHQLKHLPILGQ